MSLKKICIINVNKVSVSTSQSTVTTYERLVLRLLSDNEKIAVERALISTPNHD